MSALFLNTLIDALDKASTCSGPTEKWRAFTAAFEDVGSAFLSVGEGDLATGEVLALQTTLPHSWYSYYFDEGYQSVDPLIPKVGTTPQELTRMTFLASDRDHLPEDGNPMLRDLYEDVVLLGFDGAMGIPCPVPGSPSRVRVLMTGAGRGDEAFVHSDAFRSLVLLAPYVALETMPLERKDPHVFLERRPSLTARERDVLCLLANGLLNARIAERLGIAEPTVRRHMISAREKLGCATREQAVAVAITRGLISP